MRKFGDELNTTSSARHQLLKWKRPLDDGYNHSQPGLRTEQDSRPIVLIEIKIYYGFTKL